jgi:hypothetical protein
VHVGSFYSAGAEDRLATQTRNFREKAGQNVNFSLKVIFLALKMLNQKPNHYRLITVRQQTS